MSKGMLALFIIIGIVALLIIVSILANYRFNQNVAKEINDLFSNVGNENEIIKKSDLEGLPLSVQKWLEYSRVIGKERIKTVRLKQKAEMRLKEEQRWMPAEVEQYFTVDDPGFIWKVKVNAAPLFHFAGRDKYYEGKGNMLIKLLSLIKVADATGKEIDQGTLLRYLAETMWFPSAALSNHITWKEIDANSAQATMSYGGVTASGVFKFSGKGEVINFTAERYRESEGKYALETWLVLAKDYKEFNGVVIPVSGEVIWKIKTGDFNWYHYEIKEIEYNKPVAY